MELKERLSFVGLCSGDEFECPLTQYDIADALGLTPIHVNRVLHELRDQRLLTVNRGRVRIDDLQGAARAFGVLF